MPAKKMLTATEIVQAKDKATKVVEVPEWGGSVALRKLSGEERDFFDSEVSKRVKKDGTVDLQGARTFLLTMVLVDEAGKAIFNTEEEKLSLNGKASDVIHRLFRIAQSMNGIGEEAEKAIEGNSDGVRKDNGGSGSPDKLVV